MDPVSLLGTTLAGKYRIERVIGEGGMGVVLDAVHTELDERVAVKLLNAETAKDPEVLRRFMQEGRISARIKSEHVVRVRDLGRLPDDTPYLVMELLEGEDLATMLAREGTLPVATAVDFVLQACDPLAEAHAIGVVHRDLKPSNMFVVRRRNGEPDLKILDFGISKVMDEAGHHTSPTTMIGSPRYMSPEHLLSTRDVDARTDVWSMGIVLYELLAGRTPFSGLTLASLHVSIVNDPLPDVRELRGEVPEALANVLSRALAKNREERFSSIVELAEGIVPFASPLGRTAMETIAFAHAARVRTGGDAPAAVAPPSAAATITGPPGSSATFLAPAPPSSLPEVVGRVTATSAGPPAVAMPPPRASMPSAASGAGTQGNFAGAANPSGGASMRPLYVALAFIVLAGVTLGSVAFVRRTAAPPPATAASSVPASTDTPPGAATSSETVASAIASASASTGSASGVAVADKRGGRGVVTTPRASHSRAPVPDDRK